MGKTLSAVETRRVGSLQVSVVGVGCNNFGWHIGRNAARRVVDAALDGGINFFDTADIYGRTLSEVFLGQALGKRRAQAVVATKFGMEVGGNRPGGARPQYIRAALEDSLRRLNTDYIDLYYLHRPDPRTPIEDTIGALEAFKARGLIREYACSNFDTSALVESTKNSRDSGRGFVALQNEFNLLHRQPQSSGLLRCCKALDMAFIPYFPLKAGLLTGKYRRGRRVPEGSRLNAGVGSRFAGLAGRLLTEQNMELVERLSRFAESRGHTILELAISWLLAQPPVASVIAGATRPEQIGENVQAALWRLSADELGVVNDITSSLAGKTT